MSKTITLSRRYSIGSADFDRLEFREPKLADYRAIGKVAEVHRGNLVTFPDAIWGYADRLLVGEVPTGALGELEITDALAIEGAIVGFFTAAHEQLSARANSSSGSAGARPTSTD